MPTREYEDELESERTYVSGLYTRLDAERARVTDRFRAALRGTGGTLVDRDVEVRALAKEMKRLDVADAGHCFGRLDTVSGERSYIGRTGYLTSRTSTNRCDRLAGPRGAPVLCRHCS